MKMDDRDIKGYIEYIHDREGMRIGFICNTFNRVLYINKDWPDGSYDKMQGKQMKLTKNLKKKCKEGRKFNEEELVLELL